LSGSEKGKSKEMEEQTSWKGHSFTLLVFTGIVVLCSIFFILGMLVGRTQGQKLASIEAAEVAREIEVEPVEEKPELTFYESVENKQLPLEQPVTARREPAPAPPPAPAPASRSKAAASAPPANAISFQIGAVRKASDAEKLLGDLKRRSFRAFIVAPPPRDPDPFFRVQVGPFAEEQEAALTKRRLESAGYKPIVRK
jgi:cell division septation protein DedD